MRKVDAHAAATQIYFDTEQRSWVSTLLGASPTVVYGWTCSMATLVFSRAVIITIDCRGTQGKSQRDLQFLIHHLSTFSC